MDKCKNVYDKRNVRSAAESTAHWGNVRESNGFFSPTFANKNRSNVIGAVDKISVIFLMGFVSKVFGFWFLFSLSGWLVGRFVRCLAVTAIFCASSRGVPFDDLSNNWSRVCGSLIENLFNGNSSVCLLASPHTSLMAQINCRYPISDMLHKYRSIHMLYFVYIECHQFDYILFTVYKHKYFNQSW